MLRSDRTMSERMFEQNLTKVLVCTATLAWGVNLPGELGANLDLSIRFLTPSE